MLSPSTPSAGHRRDGTHFLPSNTPKDSLMGSIQIIYAFRFFQKPLVRNMQLAPGYPRCGLFYVWSGIDDANARVKEGGITRQCSLGISKEIIDAQFTRPWRFYASFLGAPPCCFHVVCYWQCCARSCERGYTFTKTLAQGGMQMIFMISTQFPACWWAGACFGGWVYVTIHNKKCVGRGDKVGGNITIYWQAIVAHKRSWCWAGNRFNVEDVSITQQNILGNRIGGLPDRVTQGAAWCGILLMNATSGQLAATATGTYKLQYTKAIYWGVEAEIIHLGICCYQLYIISWAIVG
jgi:hypothetical protein